MNTICKLCDGTGIVQIHNTTYKFYWCPKCKGTGFFTWLDEIFLNRLQAEEFDDLRRETDRKYMILTLSERRIYYKSVHSNE
jgi:Zn-finger nucleic acid-binding protein